MRLFLIALTSLLFFVPAFGENQPLDEKKWEKFSRDLTYEKKATEPEPEKEQKEETPDEESTQFGALKYIFMAIGGAILLGLIIFMIANFQANPSLDAQQVELQKIEKIEEHIHEVDLAALFKKYVDEGKYDFALRISFLMIIKELSDRKMIKWEKQKTNWEYHTEITEMEVRTHFSQMINHFENVWYGERHLSQPDFVEINQVFVTFKSMLGNDKKV